MSRILLVFLLSSLLFTGCSTLDRWSDGWSDRSSSDKWSLDGAPVDSEISESDMVSSQDYGEVKLVVNQPVLRWIQFFQGRGRKHMKKYIERSSRYFPMMREELLRVGLPEDLIYVPVIESGLSSQAHSHASAVGYWQFIRGTGKRYGLAINNYVDERRDPILSTQAAARYFKALYNLFGDWHLALASYNTGENRVKRVVMKYGTRNFWKLAQRRALPRETRNYVPKYLAAMIIVKNPQKYGFVDLKYKPQLAFDTVVADRPISLSKLAKHMGVKYAEMKSLNPKYRSDYVPVKKDASVNIRVPKGMARLAAQNMVASHSHAPKIIPQDYYWYKVRRGDTLSGIAVRNRTRVSTLRRLNKMGRRSFLRVGQRLRVPQRGVSRSTVQKKRSAKSSSGKSSKRSTASANFHRVREGENLFLIARKYRVSVKQLKQWNGVGSQGFIRPGQKIRLSAPEKSRSVKSSSGKSSKRSTASANFHRVREGENLFLIARKYRVSVKQLKQWNGVGSQGFIRPGQKIRLSAPEKSPKKSRSIASQKKTTTKTKSKYHIIRGGESLSTIASRYRVSVSDLIKVNGLQNKSLIVKGKRLVIPD